MTKQQIIERAYGDHHNSCRHYIDENGWCSQFFRSYADNGFRVQEIDTISQLESFSVDGKWRPKILAGIENNNGWTKIDSLDDTPDSSGSYDLLKMGSHKATIVIDLMSNYRVRQEIFENFTHWRPAIEDKNPHY